MYVFHSQIHFIALFPLCVKVYSSRPQRTVCAYESNEEDLLYSAMFNIFTMFYYSVINY